MIKKVTKKKADTGWMKFVRVIKGVIQQDQFNGLGVIDGTMFNVRFPSGKMMQLPAIVRRRDVLQNVQPFFEVEEVVYFAVPYEGLQQVWLRAIDVEVMPLVPSRKK